MCVPACLYMHHVYEVPKVTRREYHISWWSYELPSLGAEIEPKSSEALNH